MELKPILYKIVYLVGMVQVERNILIIYRTHTIEKIFKTVIVQEKIYILVFLLLHGLCWLVTFKHRTYRTQLYVGYQDMIGLIYPIISFH